MKKFILLSIISFCLASCSSKKGNGEQQTGSSGNRIEITPLIVTKVVFKDTLLINKANQTDSAKANRDVPLLYDGNPALYLTEKQFDKLKEVIWLLVQNPGSKVFITTNDKPEWNKPSDVKALSNKIVICDSLREISYDAAGAEIVKSKWYCDSTSIVDRLTEVYFYEAWHFNKDNNMLEREVLGYSFFQYIEDKQAFKQLIYVFRDEEALNRTKKYYSEL